LVPVLFILYIQNTLKFKKIIEKVKMAERRVGGEVL